MSNQELKELRERNEKRLIEAKAKLGEKWLLHPNNRKGSIAKNVKS